MRTYSYPDRSPLLDRLWLLQDRHGYLPEAARQSLAQEMGLSVTALDGVVSFYHFFHLEPAGKHQIYLDNSILAEQRGLGAIRQALQAATGAPIGGVDPSGTFGLYETSCIGLSDQEPAMLVDFQPFTHLTPERVHEVMAALKNGIPAVKLADHPRSHLRHTPSPSRTVFFRPYRPGSILARMRHMSPEEVLSEMEASGLPGLGGAFFPVGRKWRLCREQPAPRRYLIANADEGEPGTYKDRVLMQRLPGLLLEGMILGGYAAGAQEGILYLRAEYRYLQAGLQRLIDDFYRQGWLGHQAAGIAGFDFDIRIQLGAGAYVCGGETALIESLEGKRGEPRSRRYYPVVRGYHNAPTVVNNVESLVAAARIIELGADWFRSIGTPDTPGTKLMSVAGDCARPGIYEVPWGTSVQELLNLCEAADTQMVQVSGPAGTSLGPKAWGRIFSVKDVRAGGSVMIFDHRRDLLQILLNYAAFFRLESCGLCTPCRAGTYLIQRKLHHLARGQGSDRDLADLTTWGDIMQAGSRCGLGQTAANSVRDMLEQFPDYFASRLAPQTSYPGFDLTTARRAYDELIR
ncbi:MAG: NADP oxidoreductase [Bacteroidetes bacterium]|nr:MAG: NADP oxidoreductase [Bacteroidota bacterium]